MKTFKIILLSLFIISINTYSFAMLPIEVGVSVGQSNNSFDSVNIGLLTLNPDNRATSFSVFLGYNVVKYLNLNISYLKLGDFSTDVIVNAQPSISLPDGTFDIKGYTFKASPTYPITDNFEIWLNLGNFWWDADASGVGVNFNNGIYDSYEIIKRDVSDSDLFYGLGFSYKFFKQIKAKLEYNRYKIEFIEEDETIDNLSLSFSYSFKK